MNDFVHDVHVLQLAALKEAARQISELPQEDFALLHTAAADTTGAGSLLVVDVSTTTDSEHLAAQLRALVEKQKQDVSCSDSGAVSDFESCVSLFDGDNIRSRSSSIVGEESMQPVSDGETILVASCLTLEEVESSLYRDETSNDSEMVHITQLVTGTTEEMQNMKDLELASPTSEIEDEVDSKWSVVRSRRRNSPQPLHRPAARGGPGSLIQTRVQYKDNRSRNEDASHVNHSNRSRVREDSHRRHSNWRKQHRSDHTKPFKRQMEGCSQSQCATAVHPQAVLSHSALLSSPGSASDECVLTPHMAAAEPCTDTPDTSSSSSEDNADKPLAVVSATFNYEEVVKFLWKGKLSTHT